jgi:hypothetical protein
LQKYLHGSIRLLSRRSREELPQSNIFEAVIFEAVQQAEDIVSEGEREALLSLLSDIRRNLFNNVKSFVEPTAVVSEPVYNISAEKVTIIQGQKGNTTMTTNEFKIVGSTYTWRCKPSRC